MPTLLDTEFYILDQVRLGFLPSFTVRTGVKERSERQFSFLAHCYTSLHISPGATRRLQQISVASTTVSSAFLEPYSVNW